MKSEYADPPWSKVHVPLNQKSLSGMVIGSTRMMKIRTDVLQSCECHKVPKELSTGFYAYVSILMIWKLLT